MPANKFVLKGPIVEIDYVIGVTPGLVALTFHSGALQKTFTSAEISTDHTGLGMLVSIPLLLAEDTGGERFGFFLPFMDVKNGQTAHFHSVGVYELFSGPDSVPHRPWTWRSIELQGTAQSVIAPL